MGKLQKSLRQLTRTFITFSWAWKKWDKAADKESYNWSKHIDVMDYITADAKTEFSDTPWVEVDNIYIPVNVPSH